MKHQPLLSKTYLFTCIFFFAICFSSLAQLPKTNRALHFGESSVDIPFVIKFTANGGFIVLGETNSTDGDVIAGYGGTKDIWLLKFNTYGNLQWQKRYGGSGLDIGNHISVATDGSYLIAASSSFNNGDMSGNHGTGGYTDMDCHRRCIS